MQWRIVYGKVHWFSSAQKTHPESKPPALRQLGIDRRRICAPVLPFDSENGIPFSMKLEPKPENKGLQAMKEASRIAAENGIADLSLDEINAEIAAARSH